MKVMRSGGATGNRVTAVARYVLYAATVTVVILLGVLAGFTRLATAKPADDCNMPAAPVEVPKAPPGLIVDAPCTDGSAAKAAIARQMM